MSGDGMDCVVRHPVLSANLTSAGLDVLNALQNSVLSAYASHPGAVNMVLCAPPGAGKTLSYVITAVMRHIAGYRDVAAPPGILILSPTRELAAQTEGVVQMLTKGLPHFRTALLVGGAPVPPQLHRLRSPDVAAIVGTPGRIVEILAQHAVDLPLDGIHTVVLDEADALCAGTLRSQLDLIDSQLPDQCCVTVASATLSDACRTYARRGGLPCVTVIAGEDGVVRVDCGAEGVSGEEPAAAAAVASSTNNCVETVIWTDDFKDRRRRLFALFGDSRKFSSPALLFVDSAEAADMLATTIRSKTTLRCAAFHSHLPSDTSRSTVLEEFRGNSLDVLVTTNLAARGLDLSAVKPQVIVYDMPGNMAEYVHQVGRCGSPKGVYVLVGEGDVSVSAALVEHCRRRRQFIPPELLALSVDGDPVGLFPFTHAMEPYMSAVLAGWRSTVDGIAATGEHSPKRTPVSREEQVKALVGASSASDVVQYHCRPWNKDDFKARVRSFTIRHWFGKPIDISPIVCARYGWFNDGADTLRCGSCGVVLVCRLPPVSSVTATETLITSIKKSIVSKHAPLCPWLANPCPPEFGTVDMLPSASVLKHFRAQLASLHSLLGSSPTVDVKALMHRLATHAHLSAEHIADVDACMLALFPLLSGVTPSAAALALCGWSVLDHQAPSGRVWFTCEHCCADVAPSDGAGGARKRRRGEGEEGEEGEDASASVPVTESSSLDPMRAHRNFCPLLTLQAVTQHTLPAESATFNDASAFAATDKCLRQLHSQGSGGRPAEPVTSAGVPSSLPGWACRLFALRASLETGGV